MRVRSCKRAPAFFAIPRETQAQRARFIGANHSSAPRLPLVFVSSELIPSRAISRDLSGWNGSTLCSSGSCHCGRNSRGNTSRTRRPSLVSYPILLLESSLRSFTNSTTFFASRDRAYPLCGEITARRRIADLFHHDADDAKDKKHLAHADGIIFISRKIARHTAITFGYGPRRPQRARLFASDKVKRTLSQPRLNISPADAQINF